MKAQEAVIGRIEMICRERHISINRLAYITGVSPSTIKNIMYENSRNTGIVTIAKLCNGLNLSIPEFFCHLIFYGLDPEME